MSEKKTSKFSKSQTNSKESSFNLRKKNQNKSKQINVNNRKKNEY